MSRADVAAWRAARTSSSHTPPAPAASCLAFAVGGGALGVAAGSGILCLVLPPAALVFGFVYLSRAYPQEPTAGPVLSGRSAVRLANERRS